MSYLDIDTSLSAERTRRARRR